METIIANLQDPAWWFTGLFFIVLLFIFRILGKYFLRLLIGAAKSNRLKTLKRYRSVRNSQASITYSIIKAQTAFIIFIALACAYLYWFSATPMNGAVRENPFAAALIASPVFIVEVIWILKEISASDLVKEHNKLLRYQSRVKNKPI